MLIKFVAGYRLRSGKLYRKPTRLPLPTTRVNATVSRNYLHVFRKLHPAMGAFDDTWTDTI